VHGLTVALLILVTTSPPAPRDPLTERAEAARLGGDFRHAITLYEAQLRRNPNDPALQAGLAYALHAAGDDDRAAVAARAASALDADPSAAWGARVLSALEADRPGDALVGAAELVRLRPGACAPNRLAARIASRLGDATAEEALLGRSAAACPEDEGLLLDWGQALLRLGCVGRAVTVLERAERHAGTAAVTATLTAARARVAARFAEVDAELAAIEAAAVAALDGDAAAASAAEPRFRTLLLVLAREEGPEQDDPDLALRRAELFRLGESLGIDQAVEHARRHALHALELRPEWPRALVLLGVLDLSLDPPLPAEAERAFLAALALAGGDVLPPAWSGLFFVRAALGRTEDALSAADRYLAFAPEDAAVVGLRDRLRAQASR
jgi:tetratricopeptide (TPR) repeat protein